MVARSLLHLLVLAPLATAWLHPATQASRVMSRAHQVDRHTNAPPLQMGIFDSILGAFANEEYDDRLAKASHILVASLEEATTIKEEIAAGTVKFTEAAGKYSSCPSGKSGGSLGEFAPGKMVPEFDSVVFDEKYAIDDVVGPIKTQFGYHLIKVIDRRLETVKTEGKGVF